MTTHERKRGFNLTGTARSFALLLCLGTLAGVLIWSKLRLVTDIPRSAYADPKEGQPAGEDGEDAGQTESPDPAGSSAQDDDGGDGGAARP